MKTREELLKELRTVVFEQACAMERDVLVEHYTEHEMQELELGSGLGGSATDEELEDSIRRLTEE